MKDISQIIAGVLLKNAKKDELSVLNGWKNKATSHKSFVNDLETFWIQPVEEKPSSELNSARVRLLSRISAGNKTVNVRPVFFYLSRIAASVVFAVLIAAASLYIASKTDIFHGDNWVEVSTDAGQRSKAILPDGSSVCLNAETVLKYHSDNKARTVSIVGEAYFDIKHHSARPFVVEAGEVKIKVLGTQFNVAHYPGSKFIEASLLSGKITVLFDKDIDPVELEPGEKIIYDEKECVWLKTESKVQDDILWMQGILVFKEEPFSELILKLERNYAVKFIYNKDTFKGMHYTGTLNNLALNNVLEFINLTIPINYEINNKTIRLSLKK